MKITLNAPGVLGDLLREIKVEKVEIQQSVYAQTATLILTLEQFEKIAFLFEQKKALKRDT